MGKMLSGMQAMVKAFFYVYYKSLTSINYYKDVLKSSNSMAMKYFVILATIASTIITTSTSVPLLPKIRDGIDTAISHIENLYPEELVISSENSEWSINQPEPYAIKSPDAFTKEVEIQYDPTITPDKFPTNLIVFDHNGTIEDLEKLDTLMIMNGANILAKGSNKIEVYPLKDIPDGSFDRSAYNSMVEAIKPITRYIPAVVVTAILVGTLFYFFIFRMVYLIIVAVALAIVASIKRMSLPFGTLYRISVHTFTLPLTAEIIIAVTNKDIGIPFWMFIVNVVFGAVVLNSFKAEDINKDPEAVIKS